MIRRPSRPALWGHRARDYSVGPNDSINGIRIVATDYRRRSSVRAAIRTPELFYDRTLLQIIRGQLANGLLDPRGYCVSCPGCFAQGWGTPDNMPLVAYLEHGPRCSWVAAEWGLER